jgi:hypothetical protein
MKYVGVASSDYDPPTGFLTLLTVCTSPHHPGLFHPGYAHGVPPFRAFPSRRAVAPLNARCRLDVRRRRPGPRRACVASTPAMAGKDRYAATRLVRTVAVRLHGLAPYENPLSTGGG